MCITQVLTSKADSTIQYIGNLVYAGYKMLLTGEAWSVVRDPVAVA